MTLDRKKIASSKVQKDLKFFHAFISHFYLHHKYILVFAYKTSILTLLHTPALAFNECRFGTLIKVFYHYHYHYRFCQEVLPVIIQ